jgi:hypothetical protein
VSTLAVAIERKQWELASLCLLVGVVEAAAALPPDAVEGLLEVLSGLEVDDDTQPRRGARSPLRRGSGQASTGRRTGPFDRLPPRRAGRTGRGRRR